jgi:hypothetical protein
LTQEQLNRAALARQLLIERSAGSPVEAVEHLDGMQAQVPMDPYTGLWSRLSDFRPQELGAAIEQRLAVRMPLMRSTVHLVSSQDALWLWPLVRPVLARSLKSTQFGRDVAGIPMDRLLEAATAAMEEEPRTNRELRALLGPLWPDRPPTSLVYAVHYLLPLVQVPPRGVWGQTGQPRWTTLQAWLGRNVDAAPSIAKLVLRYLKAFGPAGVMDVQAWSGLTRLAEVLDWLRPQLRTFRNEAGRELFDLPDAPRPPADLPAPVRFLPEYDNLLLGHADRTRFLRGDQAVPSPEQSPFFFAVLVDGVCSATWRLRRRPTPELVVKPFAALPASRVGEVAAEAGRFADFLSPDAGCTVRLEAAGA